MGFGASLVRQADRGRRRLEDLLGVAGARPISGSELEALATQEQRLFERLRGVVSLRRAQTRELEWLLRRAPVRGIGEPRLDPHWQPDALVVEAPDGRVAYEPLGHDLWRCANAPVREEPGRPPALTVEAEEGTSHQAFVVIGALAEEAEFPGAQAELLYAPLEAVEFPVDACLHCRWLGNREALAQVRKRILDVEDSFREQAEGSARGPGWLAEEDRVLAREYEAILGSGARPPMLYGWISLALGASEPEQLERQVAALTDAYGDLALHRPRGLQERLFFDHLPRPRRRRCHRLRSAADGRAVRGADGARHPPGRLRPRRLHRLRARGPPAPGALRPDRPLAGGAQLGGAAGGDARVGQDGRRPGDRVWGRAPRLAGGRLRPQARPRLRPRPRTHEPGAGARALRGRGAPRRARPARDRGYQTCARSSAPPTSSSCCASRRPRGRTRSGARSGRWRAAADAAHSP